MNEQASGSYEDFIAGNSGSCDLACPAPLADGVAGNGQQFNGSSGISVPASSAFNWSISDSFSIELWMRRSTGITGPEVCVGRRDSTGLNWYIGVDSSGRGEALLRAANGSGPGVLKNATANAKILTSASANLVWHHVVLVRDARSNQNILYVDGKQEAALNYSAYTAGFTSETAPLSFGSLDGDNPFSGGLEEIAVYHRAMSSGEIATHYYMGLDYCNLYDSRIRIMTLGDSITNGNWTTVLPVESERTGYRMDLWELLGNNLYWANFVGSQRTGYANDGFDADNAGFPGITDDYLYTLLSTGRNEYVEPDVVLTPGPYLETYPAEIVLLHIGTNDLVDTSTTAVSNILNEIDSYSKNITVLLARIINQNPTNPLVPSFNNAIESMIRGRISNGDKIIVVDMENGAGLDYRIDDTSPFSNGDMYDNFHPNPAGYNKMAVKWFDTLETILPQSDVPVFTSTAPTTAVKGVPFSYQVTATGPPAPTFVFGSTQPSGMTLNQTSGLIQWTPGQTGDYAVSLRATNWAGQASQSFTISVYTQPQAAADAYNGIVAGGSIAIPAAEGVLSNDIDESKSLTGILVSTVSNGTLDFHADGSFTYTHNGSQNYSDGFTYKATNGNVETAAVPVTLTITQPDNPNGGGGSSGGGGGGGCFINSL